jgi:hypothetical protein
MVAPEAASAVIVSDQRVAAFDREIVRQIDTDLNQWHVPYEEAMEKVRPDLRANRRKKNREGGYWILEFDPGALAKALVGQIALGQRGAALIMTDGFSHLWDVFGVADSASGLLQHVQRIGLRGAYHELRAAARHDPECRQFPRLKPLDDAAAVLIGFEA